LEAKQFPPVSDLVGFGCQWMAEQAAGAAHARDVGATGLRELSGRESNSTVVSQSSGGAVESGGT
jgi:hypothetical protein